MIKIHNLSKSFTNSSGQIDILHNISLTIQKGQWHTIIGPSGTGKSTFLSCIAGLLPPTTGDVLYNDIHIYQLSEKARRNYRSKHVGFVFQNFKLLPNYSVLDNVMLPLIFDEPKKILYPKAELILEQVGIHSKLFERFPAELSNGEKQRIAIARALINNPDVLICDEPANNLDNDATNSLLRLLAQFQANGQTIINVTHDEAASKYADYVYKLKNKQLVADF
ncbi:MULTISPECIES: ABC transporter ATP-binding protein [Metasolibacillus]|uniref:ABC transporter ATP-binding protein n=1 Tax=Metasolibacillus TaxID=2703677 RepID=UPI00079A33CA|nr:ABC transporter ATP-binding protein [Metasolibacillus fluoroglycofenilyticus]KYG91625.1 hypothetical protein A0U40_01395 [[Bacillus] sp. KCTC 13219]